MTDIPSRPDLVTPGWLTAKLRESDALPAGDVTGLSWEPIGTGQVGDSARFHLTYSGGATGPATLAAKFPAEDATSRATAAMLGLYEKEVNFYRELAPQLDCRTPRIHAAEIDMETGDFILLFEDLGPARGGNQLEGCSVEEARQAIVQAAALHAPSWGNEDILGRDWLHANAEAAEKVRAMYPHAQAVFKERYADQLEPEFMKICEDLAASTAWLEREHPKLSLVHGDFRLDNMLFDILGGDEPIAVLDWQTLGVGNGLTDIGYFLGCGIGDSLRREYERELLDLYHREMAKRGVTLDPDEMWRDYIIGALHGVSTAVFSAAFVERTERGDANFLSMARGACALALEHDSLRMLERN